MGLWAIWRGGASKDIGVLIGSSSAKYRISWGDGSSQAGNINFDSDGDGTWDALDISHCYFVDGLYDIRIRSLHNDPPLRLRAHIFESDTDGRTVFGNALNDMFLLGSGNDIVRAGAGRDWVRAGDGDDRIDGGADSDVVFADGGSDLVRGGAGSDSITGASGDDVLYGDDDRDRLSGDVGDDTLFGGSDRDSLFGGPDDDRLFGDSGTDLLFGGDGRDRLDGGADGDVLDGGAGSDVLIGGSGRDTFEIGPDADDVADRDRIVDFIRGEDCLLVESGSSGEFSFIGVQRFTGSGTAEVRYVVVESGVIVFGDADGDRIVDFSIRLDGVIQLTEADFVF